MQLLRRLYTHAILISCIVFFYPSGLLFGMHATDETKALQRTISLGKYEEMPAILNSLEEVQAQKCLPQMLCSAVYHRQYEMVELALQAGGKSQYVDI